MIRPTPRNWWIFGLCAAGSFVAMSWLTAVMLRLDSEQAAVRAASAHQIAMSKALWRMDSWLSPQLAQESARPYYEYEAYFSQGRSYTNLLNEIEAGVVLTPSPLLTFRSEIFPLHFQVDNGKLTSPQVPQGNWKDLSQSNEVDLDVKTALLERLRSRLEGKGVQLETCYAAAVNNVSVADVEAQANRVGDYASRSRTAGQARQYQEANQKWNPQQVAQQKGVRLESLLPVWVEGDGSGPWLLYLRKVQVTDRIVYQGVLADWPMLETALLEQAASPVAGEPDLGKAVRLAPVRVTPAPAPEHLLATVPARLVAAEPEVRRGVSAGTVLVLSVTWGGLLISLLAVGFALHSTNQFGQRRARFASAVTHELRTPLTTFRMYSEMLAEDMVTDPAQRTQYLNTLRGEADRLSRLVENVLSYARIEDGRFNAHPVRIGTAALLERVRPILEQRTREAGLELAVTVAEDVELLVDVDAVTQILFNLVDNASKYAAGAENRAIEIHAAPSGDGVAITVRDHGPGIPPQYRDAIFEPFERADRGTAENETPGVGLGLALARALAEDLGGRLDLADDAPGATFRLTIPNYNFVS